LLRYGFIFLLVKDMHPLDLLLQIPSGIGRFIVDIPVMPLMGYGSCVRIRIALGPYAGK